MKNKLFRRAAVVTAALLSLTCMSVTAYAQGDEPAEEPTLPAVEASLQGRGKPPQEPGTHEKKAAGNWVGLLRFAPEKNPVFRDFSRLLSGREYPNTFCPSLPGYFVTFSRFGPTWPEAGKEEPT